ncbi:hypothetical protein FN846DRAFT_397070 [Sphaerosporella brunnea]|uniref:Uncharacterized protein n=1 Tax=Sphaerosporella brunnea TaxID=1250544 RepID=A0A5J5F5W3_9PEZI|nr:hypothetical protein FN846DRAFT_397070 [Sphaerosporella brunnea]
MWGASDALYTPPAPPALWISQNNVTLTMHQSVRMTAIDDDTYISKCLPCTRSYWLVGVRIRSSKVCVSGVATRTLFAGRFQLFFWRRGGATHLSRAHHGRGDASCARGPIKSPTFKSAGATAWCNAARRRSEFTAPRVLSLAQKKASRMFAMFAPYIRTLPTTAAIWPNLIDKQPLPFHSTPARDRQRPSRTIINYGPRISRADGGDAASHEWARTWL